MDLAAHEAQGERLETVGEEGHLVDAVEGASPGRRSAASSSVTNQVVLAYSPVWGQSAGAKSSPPSR